jgi:DNA-binding LacI/PurR family transcriptional regulator
MADPAPTMNDVARRAGVSKNTVSLALRSDPQIPEKTRRRIRALARQMGYEKNPTVAHLMAQLRKSHAPAFKSTLALVNASLDAAAFTRHPTVPVYVRGCRRRAAQLGYALDEFWLHDPGLDGKRLNRILRTRNIRGALIVGLMKENRLPARFLSTWRNIHTVVTGVRTQSPTLPYACADHHLVALKAVEQALRLGYRRPALVLDHEIDRLVDGRFSSGFRIARRQVPEDGQTEPFYLVTEARRDFSLFRQWFAEQRPDVILTLYNVVGDWLRDMGLKVPRDVGLIQLEWREDCPDWAGMDQHNDLVGEVAVEMLINSIHNHAPGLPRIPLASLIAGTWTPGTTVRKTKESSGKPR